MESKVIMYGASWCAPCKAVKPQFLEAGEGYLSELGVEFDYVDVDENTAAAVEAGVSSIPTIKLYRDGNFIKDIKSRTKTKMELEIEHGLRLLEDV